MNLLLTPNNVCLSCHTYQREAMHIPLGILMQLIPCDDFPLVFPLFTGMNIVSRMSFCQPACPHLGSSLGLSSCCVDQLQPEAPLTQPTPNPPSTAQPCSSGHWGPSPPLPSSLHKAALIRGSWHPGGFQVTRGKSKVLPVAPPGLVPAPHTGPAALSQPCLLLATS